MITNKNKPHYVYIKVFNRFMCHKTKNNNQKQSCRYFLQCFSNKKVFQEHKKVLKGKW